MDLCDGCKIRYGVELCTMYKRCNFCVHLSKNEFQEHARDKRELNVRKKTATSPHFASCLSEVVRTDIPLSPSGTTIVRLGTANKARLAEESKFRPSVAVTRMRFDIETACYNELKDNQLYSGSVLQYSWSSPVHTAVHTSAS